MVTTASERLREAASAVLSRAEPPQLGLVLGSGLGHLADSLEDAVRVGYADIPHMPMPSVAGHGGELVLGSLGGVRVACASGRVHLYEGHGAERVVFAARLLATLGARSVVLTNAAGGMGPGLSPGSLMVIDDHLNLTGQSPLVGPNDDALGPRFPDMTRAYDAAWADLAFELGRRAGLSIARGVYAGLLGPSYETPAEIRMLEALGASAVGMSTVLETIALRHMGARVLGISCVTNLAAGKGNAALDHAEVAEVAARTRHDFAALVTQIVVETARLGMV